MLSHSTVTTPNSVSKRFLCWRNGTTLVLPRPVPGSTIDFPIPPRGHGAASATMGLSRSIPGMSKWDCVMKLGKGGKVVIRLRCPLRSGRDRFQTCSYQITNGWPLNSRNHYKQASWRTSQRAMTHRLQRVGLDYNMNRSTTFRSSDDNAIACEHVKRRIVPRHAFDCPAVR